MNIDRPAWHITPFHFHERARLYRFAAALADAPGEIAMFRDLAINFEHIARQFGRAAVEPQIAASSSIDPRSKPRFERAASLIP